MGWRVFSAGTREKDAEKIKKGPRERKEKEAGGGIEKRDRQVEGGLRGKEGKRFISFDSFNFF